MRNPVSKNHERKEGRRERGREGEKRNKERSPQSILRSVLPLSLGLRCALGTLEAIHQRRKRLPKAIHLGLGTYGLCTAAGNPDSYSYDTDTENKARPTPPLPFPKQLQLMG